MSISDPNTIEANAGADVWLAEAPASPVLALETAARAPHPWRRPIAFLFWLLQSLFGIASLIACLAVLAAIPLANFMVLGYLLEVEARVARSGRLRDAFPLIHLAPRIGSIIIGIGLCLLPVSLLAGAAADARLIDAGSIADRRLHGLVRILAWLTTAHICLALARGGSLGCFFRPIKNIRWARARWRTGGYWTQAEQGIADFVAGLRLKHHFWLGFRGCVGGLCWLVPPTLLFAIADKTEGLPILITLVGGAALICVLSWVPFLQARLAVENRWGAMFELRAIRQMYRAAPLCWLMAVVVTYALSLPLYLATVAIPPSDALWLVTPVFLVCIYPARVLVGWAYHQAEGRPRAWFGWRWLSNWLLLPLLGIYLFLLFLTPSIGSHGKLVLFEHPALLLPVPF